MNQLSEEARALVELAGQSGRVAPDGSRKRMRRAILAATLVPATAAGASASLAKLVVVGVVSAAIGVGATLAVTRQLRPKVSAPLPAPKSKPLEKEPGRVEPPPSAPPSEPLSEPPSEPLPPAPKEPIVRETPPAKPSRPVERQVEPTLPVAPSPPQVPAPEVPAPDESLSAELESLDAILAAVEQHRWDDASARLDEFHARFRKPALEIEASVLEVRVRCGQGRGAEAKDASSRLRERFPQNPSVQRLDPADPCRGK